MAFADAAEVELHVARLLVQALVIAIPALRQAQADVEQAGAVGMQAARGLEHRTGMRAQRQACAGGQSVEARDVARCIEARQTRLHVGDGRISRVASGVGCVFVGQRNADVDQRAEQRTCAPVPGASLGRSGLHHKPPRWRAASIHATMRRTPSVRWVQLRVAPLMLVMSSPTRSGAAWSLPMN